MSRTTSHDGPPAFHLLAKPTGAACNLACDYCFYLPKGELYPGGSFRMDDQLLELYLRQLIESTEASNRIERHGGSWRPSRETPGAATQISGRAKQRTPAPDDRSSAAPGV